MMSTFPYKLIAKLQQRVETNSLRELAKPIKGIDFLSNDYLGFAMSSELHRLVSSEYRGINEPKNGSTGSRLLSGNSSYSNELEKYLATLFRTEASLLFNSGYTANIALLSTIPQRGDTIIMDELSHASIKDGSRLSFADKYTFQHNDIRDLDKKLSKSQGNKYVVVESIYSMDGDICPLKEIIDIVNRHDNTYLIVDEAHSTGIYGDRGEGLVCALGLEKEIFARVHTFGKAIGAHGASIVGQKDLISFLINFARPFIYTTAAPLHHMVTIKCAFEYLNNEKDKVAQLKENVAYFVELYNQHIDKTFERVESESPIQAILIPGNNEVKRVSRHLNTKGFEVKPILSPTVKKGKERLRVVIHSFNKKEDIKNIIEELESVIS